MATKKFVVKPFTGPEYEVTAERMEIDPSNTNRVTFYTGDQVVAQENSAASARPKN